VLDELAEALGRRPVQVTWQRPVSGRPGDADAPDECWELWRQDDAGNRHLMRGRLSEREARALAARYESRGHKQMYWVERGGEGRG
jgi:hypothetical protein